MTDDLVSLTRLCADCGVQVTEEGVAQAKVTRAAVEAHWPPQRYQDLREQVRRAVHEDLTGGR